MTVLGELCLLAALVTSGYAAFACIAGWRTRHDAVRRSGLWAGAASVLALSATGLVLLWALLTKDFGFDYVAQYCDKLLPWQYALAAFWVGQAGSLLLWAWFVAMLAARVSLLAPPASQRSPRPGLRPADGLPLFSGGRDGVRRRSDAAEPGGQGGRGPGAVAATPGHALAPADRVPRLRGLGRALCTGAGRVGGSALASPGRQPGDRGDAALHPWADAQGSPSVPATIAWAREARSWALFAWIVLGAGILLGAEWAYRETRLGRLLGVGPGGERLADPVADRHGAGPLPDDRPLSGHSQEDGDLLGRGHLRACATSPRSSRGAASSAACTSSAARRWPGCSWPRRSCRWLPSPLCWCCVVPTCAPTGRSPASGAARPGFCFPARRSSS